MIRLNPNSYDTPDVPETFEQTLAPWLTRDRRTSRTDGMFSFRVEDVLDALDAHGRNEGQQPVQLSVWVTALFAVPDTQTAGATVEVARLFRLPVELKVERVAAAGDYFDVALWSTTLVKLGLGASVTTRNAQGVSLEEGAEEVVAQYVAERWSYAEYVYAQPFYYSVFALADGTPFYPEWTSANSYMQGAPQGPFPVPLLNTDLYSFQEVLAWGSPRADILLKAQQASGTTVHQAWFNETYTLGLIDTTECAPTGSPSPFRLARYQAYYDPAADPATVGTPAAASTGHIELGEADFPDRGDQRFFLLLDEAAAFPAASGCTVTSFLAGNVSAVQEWTNNATVSFVGAANLEDAQCAQPAGFACTTTPPQCTNADASAEHPATVVVDDRSRSYLRFDTESTLLSQTGATAALKEHRCFVPTSVDGVDQGPPVFERKKSAIPELFY